MQRRQMMQAGGVLALGTLLNPVFAHHGWSSFDQGRPIYLEGRAVSVAWRNPHAELVLEVPQGLSLPPDLADRVEGALARRVIELVSLARKAGTAVAGYEKVRDWLTSGTAEVLIQAFDGSERGRAKLRPPHGPESLIEILSASELGLAYGRESVIHGALAGGGLTARVVEEAARLKGMRAQHVGDRPGGKGTTTI